jgi:type II secretory pathway pseudopilin PulG
MNMTSRTASLPRRTGGFTLVEMMITVLLLSVVVISLTTVMWSASRSKTASSNGIEASEAGRIAIDMLARDLRSAGYGADRDYATPQEPIAYVDSLQVLINENLSPWPDTYGSPTQPLAYDPTVTPKPLPLVATSWTPPTRYGTGAELVRWTLDLNEDGAVDATDQAATDAVDAQRTPNPDDYELVRQVYGYNGSGNGGTTQRVALVRRPCASGVGPMFTVYMKGSSTPYDWSNGPVPAAQLADIERIAVQITTPSGRRDWLGRFAESHFKTEVNSLRNVPQSSTTEYAVDGYVYLDTNGNRSLDTGEPGLEGARIKVGTLYTLTSSSGYYCVRVPAGTYWVKQVTPPSGYYNTASPESLSITVGPGGSRSFPDQAIPGGYITTFVFEDANNNGTLDMGETGKQNVAVALKPGTNVQYTNATGYTGRMFASVGACSLSVTPPDSFIVTTTNPIVLTIANGDTLTRQFGVYKPTVGTVKGKVFRDTDRDGTYDTGESGIQNVWVGVTTDGGMTVQGYANTDVDGDYTITVPANDPPHTQPYSIIATPPTGYYATSSTSYNSLYLQAGQTLTGRNFGMNSFTVITLSATRVLSLASADLIENDWNGNHTENRHGDRDIVLGSDTGGTDQVSSWWNQYSSTPLFSGDPDFKRSAPAAVLAMSLDCINVDSPLNRPDLVTGCKVAAAGNFFVWFCQNSGTVGSFPTTYSLAYKTTDQGDVQSVLTADLAGGTYPDILVGTKSPTAYTGSIELWTNSNAASPTFTQTEKYPGTFLPAGSIGEVACMALGDLNGDGVSDLVVGHKFATGGRVSFFKGMGKTASPRFALQMAWGFTNEPVTALCLADVDQDGYLDVVVGTQTAADGGRLMLLRNGGSFSFTLPRVVDAPGVVTALVAADFGGSTGTDIAVGFHTGSSSYVGGVRIYYLDSGTIPTSGVDPSGGALTNWVPALTTNDFNYGLNPAAAAPYLPDLAAAAKVTSSTGSVVIFVR